LIIRPIHTNPNFLDRQKLECNLFDLQILVRFSTNIQVYIVFHVIDELNYSFIGLVKVLKCDIVFNSMSAKNDENIKANSYNETLMLLGTNSVVMNYEIAHLHIVLYIYINSYDLFR
jgi:hypothetical protein